MISPPWLADSSHEFAATSRGAGEHVAHGDGERGVAEDGHGTGREGQRQNERWRDGV
jgi:hypothetical protein